MEKGLPKRGIRNECRDGKEIPAKAENLKAVLEKNRLVKSRLGKEMGQHKEEKPSSGKVTNI